MELNIYNYKTSSVIDLTPLNSLINLNYLRIPVPATGIDLLQIKDLENLATLSLQGVYFDKTSNIDYTQLTNFKNLNKLQINNINLKKLTGLEQAVNIETLDISIFDMDKEIDEETLSKMTNIKKLYIQNARENIDWIKNLPNLQTLGLRVYGTTVDEEFIQYLNSINIEDVQILGTIQVDLGELEAGVESEIPFDSIPIIKSVTDPESKLYNKGYSIYKENWTIYGDDAPENGENFIVDNKNKKIYVTPSEETRRIEQIRVAEELDVAITWSLPSDNKELVFSDAIKRELINRGIDSDYNGIITKKELSNNTVRYMYLYFDDEKEQDLTGIEYLTGISDLTIKIVKNMDFSQLSNLTELRSLEIFCGDNVTALTNIKDVSNIEWLSIRLLNENINLNELKELKKLNELLLTFEENKGNTLDLSAIGECTQIKNLQIQVWCENIEDLDITPIGNLTELEVLELRMSGTKIQRVDLGALSNLNKLKEFLYEANSEINNETDINAISNFRNLEKLQLTSVNASNLTGLENLEKLEDVTIISAYNYKDNLDTNTLAKMKNLKRLKINIPNELDWINNINSLEKVILVSSGNEKNMGQIVDDEFVNKLKGITKRIILNGLFTIDLGKFEKGNKTQQNLSTSSFVQELNNPNSGLYIPELRIENIYEEYYGRNEIEYDSDTMDLSITFNSIGKGVAYGYIAEPEEDIFFSFGVEWEVYVNGNKENEIQFKDENLKRALLEKYDIDGDERITEHDMINIQYADLENKDIVDISGIEDAINAKGIYLAGNKIKNAEALVELSKQGIFIDLGNNQIRDITNMSGANFVNIYLPENYIDFSENSENTRVVKESITKTAGEFYDENKDENEWLKLYSKEEYIQLQIEQFFEYNAVRQKIDMYILGDINNDEKVNARDAKLALQAYTGKVVLDENQKLAADVNGDKKVNARDAKMILQYYTGKINNFSN